MALSLLGILGSPRRGGNAECLLDEALKGAEGKGAQVEKVVLADRNIHPCRGCGDCDATGICTLLDDMPLLLDKLRTADRLVLASPVYFLSVTAQTKAMIDRCQAQWAAKYLLKRPILRGSPPPAPGPFPFCGRLAEPRGLPVRGEGGARLLRHPGLPL
ncbi:MAG: flavodoxin family protein [Chloroflexota bacterium]|nr:flavodoxin family protein [Chloroflexota bacterium]